MAEQTGRTPAEVLASNVYELRSIARLSQRELADRMKSLGHRWHQQTVSTVEDASRPVNVDELLALAVSLWSTVEEMLNPTGVAGRDADGLWLGDVPYPDGAGCLIADAAHAVVANGDVRVTYDGQALRRRPAPQWTAGRSRRSAPGGEPEA